MDKTAFGPGAAATIGTPDDLVARIKSVLEISGGFGTVVGFVHDWANPENTMRSWDMVARYVVPEINGYLAGLRKSREFVATNREYFNRAREAVMAKITENEAAAAALAVTKSPLLAASSSNVPDLDEARARLARSWSALRRGRSARAIPRTRRSFLVTPTPIQAGHLLKGAGPARAWVRSTATWSRRRPGEHHEQRAKRRAMTS